MTLVTFFESCVSVLQFLDEKFPKEKPWTWRCLVLMLTAVQPTPLLSPFVLWNSLIIDTSVTYRLTCAHMAGHEDMKT